MHVWFVPLLLMPLIDQGVKHLLRRRLGLRSLALGPSVSLRMVNARVWLTRAEGPPNLARMWILWVLAAGGVAILAGVIPASRLFVGLLLGGSLSHALETSLRGSVSDYICSTWWPAFNLADVAITIGALGVLTHALIALQIALA
jgi:lipoprotein signal peptidase